MTSADLLIKVKTGLSITGNHNDTVLMQKMLAVTMYMTNAGIDEENLYSDLGVVCIIVGITDIWDLSSGEIKLSPVFGMLLEQLAVKSIEEVI